MKDETSEEINKLQAQLDQLQKENELFKSILNSNNDLQVFSVDKSYRYTSINRPYQEEVYRVFGEKLVLGDGCLDHLRNTSVLEQYKKDLDRAFMGEASSRVLLQPLTNAYYEISYQPAQYGDTVTGAIVFVKNISQQKQSDESLKQLSSLLYEAQETSKTGNWEWNLQKDTIWWSDQLYRNLEVTPETFEACPLNKVSLIHPDDFEKYKAQFEDLFLTKGRMELDLRVISGKGNLRYCSSKARVECDDAGNISRVFGTLTDITARVLEGERLKESDERFKKIYEEGPFGIGMVGPDFKFIMANSNFCEMVGYSESELQSRSFQDISNHDDFLQDLPNIKKLISGEIKVYKTEKRYIGKEGREIWGSLTVTANFDKEGKFLYNVAIIEDITRRKLAEVSLRRVSERLELATQASNIGIWDWDIQKNELVWDKQMYSLYGIEDNKLPTAYEAWLKGLHPDDRESSDRISQQAVWEKQAYDTEFRVLWPDGSIHWLKSIGQVFYDDEGKPLRMVGVNYDISERKHYEAAIIESRLKLETALDSIADAVLITDSKGDFIDFNDAFATFHKFARKEECARTLTEYPDLLEVRFGTGEPAPFEQWAVPRALRGEISRYEEYILKRRDTGEEWYGSYSFAPIRDKDGIIVGSVLVGRDITERKMIENALKESEALFSTIFHASPFPISFTRIDSDIWEDVNEAFLSMTGYKRDEIIGKTYLDINLWKHPDKRLELRKLIEEQGSVSNFEIEIIKKNGEEGIVLLFVEKFELKKNPYLLFLANEITEKKKNEIILRRNAALLNEMGKVAKIGGWEFDPLTGEGSWTAEVARIHDLEIDVPTSRAMGINFYTEVSKRIIEKAIEELLATGKGYDLELELISAKGIHKWVRTIGHPVIEEGKIVNVRGSFQDISEQKMAESILRLQSERLRVMHEIDHAILQSMQSPESIALTALSYIKGILDYKMAMVGFFNPETNEMNYYSEDETNSDLLVRRFNLTKEQYEGIEFLGKSAISVVSDIKDVEVPQKVAVMLQQLGIHSFVNTPLFSAQAFYGTLNIGWGASRKVDPGELEIIEEVSSQISLAIEQSYLLKESRRYTLELEERVKERTRQLQESNKELEAFTYSVSHDLRAPLRHINGYIDLVINKYNEALPEKGKHYLETILDSATQMGTLIDDLLQFSRTGRQEMRQGNLDMNSLVDEVIQSMSAETANREIEWNIASLPRVYGDHSLLRMVWINLLSNAVKYTREKEKAIIEIKVTENSDSFTFSVKDNGAGFDMNYAHKLFGVFQRLHTTSQFEGTGIGLANVRRIINKHGGETWAEAELGRGATFFFSIPKPKETLK